MKHHEALPLVAVERGRGAWLYDFEGRRYLDGVSSWWVNLFGHGHPAINAALRAQLETLDHVMLAGFTHRPVVELSERLAALAPHGLGHCFYGSDGASAVEIALKMSAHFWRNTGRPAKTEFVALAGGYHGETLGALGVTDVPLFRGAYAPLVRLAATVPTPDPRAHAGASPVDAARIAADALEAWLAGNHARTAALILEPLVQGACGMAMHDPSYLRRALELCARFEVHLIADEIMTGFGRTGSLFAWEQAQAPRPDFLCLSKGLTGGTLPMSVVMTTDEVFAAFYDDDLRRGFLHSHSYTGNPLACSAALAVLGLFADHDVLAQNELRAARLTALAEPVAAHAAVRNFRRRGMIWAFEVETGRADFARWCFAAALEREVLLRPIGNTVYWMPPYILDDNEMRHLAEATLEIVRCA